MNVDVFWSVLETSQDSDRPLDQAVAAHLSTLTAEDILAFEVRFDHLRGVVHRWDVWAAAYLIGGGCGDDRFSDFTAGLVALGREWFERVAACPDVLAEHPAVRRAAAEGDQDVIFDEGFNFAAAAAYERLTGDAEAFWTDLDACMAAPAMTEVPDDSNDMGESFDFTDDRQMHRRLPRLAALHLRPGCRPRPRGNGSA